MCIFSAKISIFSTKKEPFCHFRNYLCGRDENRLMAETKKIGRDKNSGSASGRTNEFSIAQYGNDAPSHFSGTKRNRGYILLTTRGRAVIEHNHRRFEVEPSSLVHVFHGDTMSFAEVSDDFETYSFGYTNDKVFNEVMRNIPGSFINHLTDNPVYRLNDEASYDICMTYFRLLATKIADRDNICRHEIVVNIVRNLYLDIYDNVVRFSHIDTTQSNHKRHIMDRFVALLMANPGQRNVAFFADALCISPKYLSVITQEVSSLPAKWFIVRNIIFEIEQELRTTDLSIKQISERFDFPDTGEMCRFFKRYTGTTVSEFRQRSRGVRY